MEELENGSYHIIYALGVIWGMEMKRHKSVYFARFEALSRLR